WQRVLVLLAGPGIQLLLFAFLFGLAFFLPRGEGPAFWGPYPRAAYAFLLQINLLWALLNLVPVFPLDAGQVTREVCQAGVPEGGGVFAMGLSMVVAATLAVHALLGSRSPLRDVPYLPSGEYTGIFFALLAVTSFQALQMENERIRYLDQSDDRLPW